MPIFEFHCKDCDTTFEVLLLRAADIATVRCAHCNGSNIHKILSAGSIQSGKSALGNSLPMGGGCAGKSGFS